MTRSYYAKHEKKFNQYIGNHASTSYSGDDMSVKKQVQVNKNILLSKINANMLIKCDSTINPDQVKDLQKYKEDSYRFDSSKAGFSELVEVTFTDYDISADSAKEGQLPEVKFTTEENKMLAAIEDIND